MMEDEACLCPGRREELLATTTLVHGLQRRRYVVWCGVVFCAVSAEWNADASSPMTRCPLCYTERSAEQV